MLAMIIIMNMHSSQNLRTGSINLHSPNVLISHA